MIAISILPQGVNTETSVGFSILLFLGVFLLQYFSKAPSWGLSATMCFGLFRLAAVLHQDGQRPAPSADC